MYNRYSYTSKLPPEIRDFLRAHKIKVMNDSGEFGGGIDPVFFWLTSGGLEGSLQLGIDNLHIDERFTIAQKEELLAILKELYSRHDVYAKQEVRSFERYTGKTTYITYNFP